ncbi:MAG: alpha/beta fold hydrolase, partial [Clostridia bacterium]|nr:alpha/beta fold hydrolase [Clostridia bacterium]
MVTKYPIVLTHGIVLKDVKFFKAFGHIETLLRDNGYSVHTSQTDGFGSIENNAAQLKAQIEEIMQAEGVDKVNIIAHSKGGLDSRYMIDHLDMAEHVASLTFLCTPHKGS